MINGFEPVLDIGTDSTKRMKGDEGINIHASQRDDKCTTLLDYAYE